MANLHATPGFVFRPGVRIFSAMLLPFGSFLLLRRRRLSAAVRTLGSCAILLTVGAGLIGCSYTPRMYSTPTGTANITIAATSGSTVQTSVIALTVK
jgi:hypothetical protein